MNRDIRLLVGLPEHPKVMKLMRRIGDKAFWHLIKLWCFVAQNKPDGILTGLDSEDIEIAAGWNGECGLFFKCLQDLNWIEETAGNFIVHDWDEHQGWACGARARSEAARKAATARWEKKLNHAPALPPHEIRNAPSPSPSPNPPPSPSPKPDKKKEPFVESSDELRLASHLFTHIRKNNPNAKTPNLQAWAKHIDYMLRIDHRTVDDIELVISWCQKDSFWMANILSTEKLRKQYDKLWLKMTKSKPGLIDGTSKLQRHNQAAFKLAFGDDLNGKN